MSLTSAFNGALSGLQAFSRMSEAIASNVANSTTESYAPRSVTLSSNSVAPGVDVLGVSRSVDPVTLSVRRTAEADLNGKQVINEFSIGLLNVIGTPEDARSLSAHLARFESSLVEAASAPDAPARLQNVVYAAVELTDKINSAAQFVSDARGRADAEIATQVDQLNSLLSDVEELNAQITSAKSRGVDANAFFDQRQGLIDDINGIVPVKEIARPNGGVALFSEAGAILLDTTAVTFNFDATQVVTPYQQVSSGTLSQLMINSDTVETLGDRSPIHGGSLAAQFQIRDALAVEAQTQLDTVARDLISRFQSSDVDPSLSGTDPGLLTDAGNRFDAANEIGLANRLELNRLVTQTGGNETWRLRTGLAASAPGYAGESTLLSSMAAALTERQPAPSGNFGVGNLSTAALFGELGSWASLQAVTAERQVVLSTSSYSEARSAELSRGVDTDAELQNLLIVENAYAANAQVLTTIDEMLETVLRIT